MLSQAIDPRERFYYEDKLESTMELEGDECVLTNEALNIYARNTIN